MFFLWLKLFMHYILYLNRFYKECNIAKPCLFQNICDSNIFCRYLNVPYFLLCNFSKLRHIFVWIQKQSLMLILIQLYCVIRQVVCTTFYVKVNFVMFQTYLGQWMARLVYKRPLLTRFLDAWPGKKTFGLYRYQKIKL